jgi:hypothetical protein
MSVRIGRYSPPVFVETKDLLGQWYGYSGTGGYAVGVKLAALLSENGSRFAAQDAI